MDTLYVLVDAQGYMEAVYLEPVDGAIEIAMDEALLGCEYLACYRLEGGRAVLDEDEYWDWLDDALKPKRQYVQADGEGYVVMMSTSPLEDSVLMDVDADFMPDDLFNYRVVDGAFVLDEARHEAWLASIPEPSGDVEGRIAVLEEQVGEILPAQLEALGILGVSVDG